MNQGGCDGTDTCLGGRDGKCVQNFSSKCNSFENPENDIKMDPSEAQIVTVDNFGLSSAAI